MCIKLSQRSPILNSTRKSNRILDDPVSAAENFWSLRRKSLLPIVYKDRLDEVSISLNCPVLSHKWDSSNLQRTILRCLRLVVFDQLVTKNGTVAFTHSLTLKNFPLLKLDRIWIREIAAPPIVPTAYSLLPVQPQLRSHFRWGSDRCIPCSDVLLLLEPSHNSAASLPSSLSGCHKNFCQQLTLSISLWRKHSHLIPYCTDERSQLFTRSVPHWLP